MQDKGQSIEFRKAIKKYIYREVAGIKGIRRKKNESHFDQKLKGLLSVRPPKKDKK